MRAILNKVRIAKGTIDVPTFSSLMQQLIHMEVEAGFDEKNPAEPLGDLAFAKKTRDMQEDVLDLLRELYLSWDQADSKFHLVHSLS